ncbi:MAG: ribonuclease J [Anaerolineae bacterium]|nr:ribonuclease J [Anaerolineales bacterium]MCQ3978965.1 ribonuclease J [Anaerolineae bacterium]
MATNQKLKIVPLGGLGEVGKNMLAVEYGRNVLIVDAGVMFPEQDMLGIDLVIPDWSQYLKDKKEWVRGIVVTHGHEDHIGALPYLLAEVNAPVYGTRLTVGLIDVKLQKHNLSSRANLHVVSPGERLVLGGLFEVEFFHVCHSIPDAVGLAIRTPVGLIVHSGDFKFDHTPTWGLPPDFGMLARLGSEGVLLLMADSTNADTPGFTPSEKTVDEGLDRVFREAKGRVILATFGSLISRVQQIINIAARHGRVVAVDGRSLEESVERAQTLGYLNIPPGVLVDLTRLKGRPDHQIAIIATGSQGEPSAALGRMANGKHRHITIKSGDTVVMSSRVIPGNDLLVGRAINKLFKRGARVIGGKGDQVHVSGHASQEELKLLLSLVKPKYFMPVHGELRHLHAHAGLARSQGIPEQNILVVENGMVVELDEASARVMDRVPGGWVFVDGSSVGDIGPAVLRDREILSQDGFVLATVRLNEKTGQPVGRPQIVTRGFIFVKDNQELIERAEDEIMAALRMNSQQDPQLTIRKALSELFYSETQRQPMVIPVIVEA